MSGVQLGSRAMQTTIRRLASDSGSVDFTAFPKVIDGIYDADAEIQSLQARLLDFEDENKRLKAELHERGNSAANLMDSESTKDELRQSLHRIADMESQLKLSELSLKERTLRVESLEHTLQTSSDTLEGLRAESEARLNDLQAKIDDDDHLIGKLKEAVDAKSTEVGENEGIIRAKDSEIGLLDSRLKEASAELEEVRRELTHQIDELRLAGQETIALYEERLGTADSKRYELEDLVEELEDKVRRQSVSAAPDAVSTEPSQASRIDNETLREQLTHLQKRNAELEEMLEDARIASEKEASTARSRIQKYKDNEASMKKEVADARVEVDRASVSEATAKDKLEEVEEALRENLLALENARAEIEILRGEVAVRSTRLSSSHLTHPGLHSRAWKADVRLVHLQLQQRRMAPDKRMKFAMTTPRRSRT